MQIADTTGMKIGWFINKIHPSPTSATFLVKGTFDLHSGKTALLSPEQENLNGDIPEEEGGLYYPSDFAWFKPRTDLLLSATCYPPGGTPQSVCRVTFQVGKWIKQLTVIGNRVMKKQFLLFQSPSEPEPFDKLKLTYAHSYGGKEYAQNPIGQGHRQKELEDGTRIRPLPNIVNPNQVIPTGDSRPLPAGFSAIDPAWIQRTCRMGSYGSKWKKERWPGFPADYDWTMQNAAPHDQQLAYYLKGNEKVLFENLRAENPVYESRLPGVRVRWFLEETFPSGPQIREIPLHLDTLWVDLNREKLILLWRGTAGIKDPALRTVLKQTILTEPCNGPGKSLEEVTASSGKKQESPPLPHEAKQETALPDMTWKKEFEEQIETLRKELMTLDEEGPDLSRLTEILPSPESEPDYAETKDLYQSLEKSHPELAEKIGPPPSPEDFEKSLSRPTKKPRVAWNRTSCEKHASEGGSFDGEDLRGLDLSGLGWEGVSFRGTLLNGANMNGARFTEANLSGANLSEATISGGDFTGANLTQADLTRTDLSKTNFSFAILPDADFSGATLSEANLSEAKGARTTFFGANLEGANLTRADFQNADLTSANLSRITATEADLTSARAAKVIAKQAILSRATLTGFRAGPGADFSEAQLDKVQGAGSIWQEAILDRVNFRESSLAKSNFAGASLKQTILDLCDLRKSNFPGATLEKSCLLKSNLFQTNFRGALLKSTDFRGSNLFESEFLEATIEGNSFELANLEGTKLV